MGVTRRPEEPALEKTYGFGAGSGSGLDERERDLLEVGKNCTRRELDSEMRSLHNKWLSILRCPSVTVPVCAHPCFERERDNSGLEGE
jgi:hypothetical protein